MEEKQRKKQISIQDRINEVMNDEFDKLLSETGNDPILQLVRSNDISGLSIKEIKKRLGSANR